MTLAMMKIKVLYFARLQEVRGISEEIVSVAAGATPQTLYRELERQYAFGLPESSLRAARNHVFCDWQEPLTDGDVVAFIPPVAGG
ncbi:MAG: MoaD/ThiS family protein [Neisseria sp.]|nr:MoaD/ThiS family protein [Neisseria sp.]